MVGAGETVANGIPTTAGKSWGVTRGYLCPHLRLGETAPRGQRGSGGFKGAPPSGHSLLWTEAQGAD